MSGNELLAGKSQYLVMLVGLVGREKVSLFSSNKNREYLKLFLVNYLFL